MGYSGPRNDGTAHQLQALSDRMGKLAGARQQREQVWKSLRAREAFPSRGVTD